MAKDADRLIVCYEVWAADRLGSYDATAVYDDWTEVVNDIHAALDHGRQVLIERTFVMRREFESWSDAGAAVWRLRGDPAPAAGREAPASPGSDHGA